MKNPLAALLAVLLAVLPLQAAAQRSAPATASKIQHPQLSVANKPWKGDFDRLLERRMIRVLVPYSRSLFFLDHGRERGITADLVRDFERYLNQKHAKRLGKRPLTVYIIPTTRERLLPHLQEGLGDIAAGNLTITEERLALVDFATDEGAKREVTELVVTGPTAPAIATLEDLSGEVVHVRPSSSYAGSLAKLNARLEAAGKPPVLVKDFPEALEDEDAMEMLNAGLVPIMVVDDWKARMWAQVLPKVKVREDLVLAAGGRTGWAFRKDSPQMREALRDFAHNYIGRPDSYQRRVVAMHKRVKQVKNSAASEEARRFEAALELFEAYGPRYGFDPLMLAAQGYQESQLRQEARSHVGAIGVMQIMPATGRDMKVGDITKMEPNIHAGAKYMDFLMRNYFTDAHFDAGNRPLFAFAAYNCGPGNIQKFRKEAEKRGLDPDKWFNNVELVVADRIGTETTTYVRNIYKYYVAYRLVAEARAATRRALETAKTPGK